jgi:hypothetical protein
VAGWLAQSFEEQLLRRDGAMATLQEAMAAFRSAAALRGAYAKQCQAAEAALQLL